MNERSLFFHVDLLQDVAVLRPLIFLAKTLPGFRIEVLTSSQFDVEDDTGRWRRELATICSELEVPITSYASELEAVQKLRGKHGMLIAGSESNAPNHSFTHRLFHSVPSTFVKVTLQHGFECLGFLHNRAHDQRFGMNVRFAADVIVGWFAKERLQSVTAIDLPKLYVAGPPMLIDTPQEAPRRKPIRHNFLEGIVCENLHSLRLAKKALRTDFLDQVTAFAERIGAAGGTLHLRTHPAGRFVERKNIQLPAGMLTSNDPLYRMDLQQFSFAISPPSTVLFDFVLAGVPVAAWIDPDSQVDLSNFLGLHMVSTAEDWWDFAVCASVDRDDILTAQDRFVESLRIPPDVRGRYASLMSAC